MVMSAEYKSKRKPLHNQWWRLQKSKNFERDNKPQTKKPKETNEQSYVESQTKITKF